MIPDSGIPLVGIRGWALEPGGRLRSLTRDAVWSPGEPLAARCSWPVEADHLGLRTTIAYTGHTAAPPAPGCACGIYVRTWPIPEARHRDHVPEVPGPVVGFAALWGTVILDEETGICRGQWSIPLALCTRYCYDQVLAPVPGFPEGGPSLHDLHLAAERYALPVSADLDELAALAREELRRRMLAASPAGT